MANWANPTLTSSYTNFVTEVKDRDTDVAVWFEGITPTNTPTNAKRLNTSTGRFEKWNGTAWVDAVATFTFPALSVAGAATVTGALTINGGIANNPTLTAGTANGVAYLDGSKVLTTGSALTFNGTTLATTGTISADGELQNSGGRLAMYRAAGASYIDWASGQSLIWRTVTSMGGAGAATQMALTSTGLGIGTSSPTRRVTVGGTANALMDFNATSYRRYSIGSDANGFIVFDDTAGAYRLTVDASGNLGLAVTPSAWGSEHAAFQLGFSGAIQSYKAGTTAEYLSVISNAYNDNANWRYIRDGAATRYELFEGAHRWFSSASGTAGNAISFTQAMTLDTSGRLGIGTSSPSAQLHVNGTGAIFSYLGYNYAAASQVVSSADAIFGGGVIADTPNATQVKKTVADDGHFIRIQISDGIAFHTGLSGAAGATFSRTANERMRLDASGNLIANSSVTGHWQVPRGTTAQRTGSPASGMIRFNTTLSRYEGHNGTGWASIGGGATGGGSDDVFYENGQTVTTNYTITTNKNAMSAGPVTIASGITVTVPSGSTWVVV